MSQQEIRELPESEQKMYSNQYFMGNGPRATRLKQYVEDSAFFSDNFSQAWKYAKISHEFDFREHMVDQEQSRVGSPKRLDDVIYQQLVAVSMLLLAMPLREFADTFQTEEWKIEGVGSVVYGKLGLRRVSFNIPGLENRVVGHCYCDHGLTFKFDHVAEGLRLTWAGYMFKTMPQGLGRVLDAFIRAKYPSFIPHLATEVLDEATQVTNKEHDAQMLLNEIYEILRNREDRVLDKMRYQGNTFCDSMRLWFRPHAGARSADSAHIGWCYWVLGVNYQVFFNLKFSNFEPKLSSEFQVLDKKIVNHFLLMVLYEVTMQKLRRGVEHAKTFVYKPSTT